MKKLLLLSLLITGFTQAQNLHSAPWMENLLSEKSGTAITYDEIKKAGDSYWSNRDKDAKGSGYKIYRRWLENSKAYINPDGTLQTNAEFEKALKTFDFQKGIKSDVADWMPMGPFSHTNTGSWSSGQGRVNSITVDPNDSNIYYIATPGGGAWKSIDAGVNWSPLNDYITRLGASAVAVDPNNSNIVYVGTGDDDGGDSPCIGLLKSTDGGATFSLTGLKFPGALANVSNISEVYIDPSNSNKVIVSSRRGFYMSLNAGTSFSKTFFGNVKDVKFKPGHPNTIYLATDNSFHISTDGGDNWSEINTGLPSKYGKICNRCKSR